MDIARRARTATYVFSAQANFLLYYNNIRSNLLPTHIPKRTGSRPREKSRVLNRAAVAFHPDFIRFRFSSIRKKARRNR